MFTVRLEASDRPALLAHFLALGNEDRRLRFGFVARDSSIKRYVQDMDFDRDAVFGVHGADGGGRQFDGITHLALTKQQAEIGVSVLEHARGQGIGTALVSRAAVHARNLGIDMLYMQCLSENGAIMRIARALGMTVVTTGRDSQATLAFPGERALRVPQMRVADPIALCDAALCDTPSASAQTQSPQPLAGHAGATQNTV